MVAKQAHTFGDDSRPICPIQFHNYRRNIEKDKLTCIRRYSIQGSHVEQCAYDVQKFTR